MKIYLTMNCLPKELINIIFNYKYQFDNIDVKLLDIEDLHLEKIYLEKDRNIKNSKNIKLLLRYDYICVKLENND